MWLITKVGFFSVVEKPGDKEDGQVTIRARVFNDLENLRYYLPILGEIVPNAGTDYPYRARVPKADFATAASKIALDIDYGNFKDKVAKSQGKARASAYAKVWQALWGLQ